MEPGGGNGWRPDRRVRHRQMSTRAAAVIALTSAAIVGPGCGLGAAAHSAGAAGAKQSRSALPQYRDALRLSLTIPSAVVAGTQTPLRFRLQNAGSRAIETCVGEAREVRVVPENDTDGIEGITISEVASGRPPVCRQRVGLAPGEQFEWSETTAVSGIVRGFATLEVDVQIVDPRRCDSPLGCPDMRLTASAPVEIR